MVTFPDKVHPKHGLTIRFKYSPRAIQYLKYFDIILYYPDYKFIPLDLTFNNADDLLQFLVNRGIVRYEVEMDITNKEFSDEISIVDTKKIYDVEESVTKYLLNYKYYSVNEVAEILSFSRPSVYKFVNDHTLKAIRINGQLRINHLDLIAFINKNSQQ
ncbi:MAG: helix-turn-helix domain-containing protein [Bacteroidia bacterium]|nr:helix-turn-helix domain-containing protein [Bacteroidia bacterium]